MIWFTYVKLGVIHHVEAATTRATDHMCKLGCLYPTPLSDQPRNRNRGYELDHPDCIPQYSLTGSREEETLLSLIAEGRGHIRELFVASNSMAEDRARVGFVKKEAQGY